MRVEEFINVEDFHVFHENLQLFNGRYVSNPTFMLTQVCVSYEIDELSYKEFSDFRVKMKSKFVEKKPSFFKKFKNKIVGRLKAVIS